MKTHRRGREKELPALFFLMEAGEWDKATDRVRKHPKEAMTWATLRTKTSAGVVGGVVAEEGGSSTSTMASAMGSTMASNPTTATTSSLPYSSSTSTKRLALHHACFKLRNASAHPRSRSKSLAEDPFINACQFILTLIETFPRAAGQRETRHGCLPLHLAAFATCVPQALADQAEPSTEEARTQPPSASTSLARPVGLSGRIQSDATADTHLSAMYAEESYTGVMADKALRREQQRNGVVDPNVSVTMRAFFGQDGTVDKAREEMAVNVINALLDAYPKGAKMDCEGGRLPLHTACAGRAAPRVISTLVTAYTAGARQRNKDGFLPLHLAAHWGISDPEVATTLLRVYPDATVGRNRWERTPLEEALCMAGENGRHHQTHLVRALRKHPSYWTRPPRTSNIRKKRVQSVSTVVDMDESLPSIDTPSAPSLEDSQQDVFDELPLVTDTQAATAQRSGPAFAEIEDVGMEVELDRGESEVKGGRLLHRLTPKVVGRRDRRGKQDTDNQKSSPTPAEAPAYSNRNLASLIHHKIWSLVPARLEAHPMEAEEELEVMTKGGFLTHSGMTPLHYLCERNPPVSIVRALIEAFPIAALKRAMPGGCLALHVAVTWNASLEVVTALLAADEGAVHVKDELGNVPLHSACFSGAKISVLEILLQADPTTVLARNHQGSRPVDVCKRLNHENRQSALALLTSFKRSVVGKHNRTSSSGTWAEVAQEADEINRREGAPKSIEDKMDQPADPAMQENQATAVEVTYQQSGNNQELLWI